MFVIISKIFALLLAGIAISKSYVDFRSRAESAQLFVFWFVTWLAIVIIALFPSIVDFMIFSVGGERAGLGTFFGMAIVFLYFVVYRIYVKQDRMEQKLIKMVQELSLRDLTKTR